MERASLLYSQSDKGQMMSTFVKVTLEGVATLLDAVALELENKELSRNQKLDQIRCSLEDFREDLEEQIKDIEVVKC